MDGTTTTFGKQHGVYISRKVIALITAIFVIGIIATGLLAYNLTSCPSSSDLHEKYHHEDYHNTTTKPFSITTQPTELEGTTEEANAKSDKLDVRLPRSIQPNSYHLKIVPFIFENNFTFHGEVDIIVKVIEDTSNITLHIDDIRYEDSSISVVSLSNDFKIGIERIENDSLRQFLVIHLEEELVKNKLYKLHIKYSGVLNDILQGFYRSSYRSGNQTR